MLKRIMRNVGKLSPRGELMVLGLASIGFSVLFSFLPGATSGKMKMLGVSILFIGAFTTLLGISLPILREMRKNGGRVCFAGVVILTLGVIAAPTRSPASWLQETFTLIFVIGGAIITSAGLALFLLTRKEGN